MWTWARKRFPSWACAEAQLDGMPVRVIRAGFVSSLGFEIHTRFGDGARVWERLLGARATVRAFGVEAQRVLRLERGHAIVAQDTDALTTPFEAGLGWAVRMDKPFFLGQRSLRIHEKRGARQQADRLRARRRTRRPPVLRGAPADSRGDIAGRVTSVARSPTLGRPSGFAMAKPSLAEVGMASDDSRRRWRPGQGARGRDPFVEAA